MTFENKMYILVNVEISWANVPSWTPPLEVFDLKIIIYQIYKFKPFLAKKKKLQNAEKLNNAYSV